MSNIEQLSNETDVITETESTSENSSEEVTKWLIT